MENPTTQNQSQEPLPNPAPVPAPSANRTWLVVAFTVLFLIVLASTAFLYYQNLQLKSMLAKSQLTQPTPTLIPTVTPDPTANWKTYTNAKYNFSFKYPSSWVFKEVSAPGLDDQVWLAANLYSLPSGTYGGVGNNGQPPIRFQISKEDDTAIGWAPEQWNNLTLMPYTVGNLQGTIRTGTSKEGLSKVTVISAKMGNVYINILPLEVTEKASLDQILSTFKFTDQTTDTSTWKTYTNEKLPYSISYPTEFQADVTWEQNSGAIIGFRINKKVTEPTGPFGSYISIRINNPQQPSENNFDPYLSMAVGETKETEPLTQQSNTRLADIKIDGVVAKSYINKKPWEFSGTVYLYIIDYKKSLYIIDEGVGTDNVSKALLDQIISTFKFTN